MRVLYIDCDSLRPDHLGCYGYHRDTSPNIDALAADARRFTNYHVTDAPCLPSRTALFSGRFGFHTGVVNHGGRNADPRRTGHDRGFKYESRFRSWLTTLGDAGLHTASISPFPPRHDAWQVLEGVDEYHDTGRYGREDAHEVYGHAKRWLESHATDDDWFLHLNFWDPHAPYTTPEEYGNPFADDPAPKWLTEERIDAHYASYSPHGAHEPHGVGPDFGEARDLPRMPAEIDSREAFTEWVDGYDVGVHYFDHHVGKIVEDLRAAGVFEDTLVIVSADHGENLGELNVYGDHQTADHPTARVPLIVHGPEVEAGVSEGFHYQIDLPATVTELAGETPPAGWDGESFAATLTDGADTGRDFLVLSQGAWACQRGVRWEDWLLLRTYHDGYKAALDDVLLFDLAEDPHETTDFSEERPEVVDHGLALLQRWIDDRLLEGVRGERGGNPDTPDGVTDPMMETLREGGPFHARGHLEAYTERLRETGREDCAAALLADHGDEG